MEIDYSVVKSNDIVQKVSYSLSANEQKLLLYIISKIKPTDKQFQTYSFHYVDLLKVFGVKDTAPNRKIITDSCNKLVDKSIYFIDQRESNKPVTHCHWLSIAKFTTSTVTVRIEEELKQYLLELSEQFTQYQLRQIMTMKSRYSIRLYEICKSHSFETHFTIGIEELKTMLESKYVWRDLKSKILDPAKEEINNKSDLLMDYMPIKTGKKYTDIRFTVLQKDRTEALQTQAREERKLYGYEY